MTWRNRVLTHGPKVSLTMIYTFTVTSHESANLPSRSVLRHYMYMCMYMSHVMLYIHVQGSLCLEEGERCFACFLFQICRFMDRGRRGAYGPVTASNRLTVPVIYPTTRTGGRV